MDLGLTGKSVIVTGGSRGYGFAIANAFAREGANISICARGRDNLGLAAKRIASHGNKVHGAVCDVTNVDALEGYIETAASKFDGLDILVNNPTGHGGVDDEDRWLRSFSVDLMALVRASKKAVPFMENAGGGCILHMSSIFGLHASRSQPAYGAIKAAIIQYTKTQAVDLSAKGIRVNCLAPGYINAPGGPIVAAIKSGIDDSARKAILSSFKKLDRRSEVANVVVFLASGIASGITGQTIVVDGGQSLL
ncbi:SDR family oxidoreductase [Alphaproteobacteria bacterium]|nr:SDR family oxidoreductase [Alphaproteobacteria bacterium]